MRYLAVFLSILLAIPLTKADNATLLQLLSQPCTFRGAQQKIGPLPIERWGAFDAQPFRSWLRNYSTGNAAQIQGWPAPQSAPCSVWVNDAYNFFYIKSHKVGGSSFIVAHNATRLCAGGSDPLINGKANCLRRATPLDINNWMQYTVLGQVRNPWSRAASAYTYIPSLWMKSQRGMVQAPYDCQPPSFHDFTANPLRMGVVGNLFFCTRTNIGFVHDFAHVEPLHWCYHTSTGASVVDYVISYEDIRKDMAAALQLISNRRPAGTPPIELRQVPWHNAGKSRGDGSVSYARYIELYHACGSRCINNLADVFGDDITFFGCKRA